MDETIKREAFEALRKRLALLKSREDIDILAVTGVEPDWVQDWISSEPGLVFAVDFTYTSGRRQRRNDRVGFRLLPPSQPTDSDVLLPATLIAFLNAAVAASSTQTGYLCKQGNGPSPTGAGYATSQPATSTIDTCPCGASSTATM